ncbi:hypothetical protein LTS10_008967 [Elasticomyces elasticus]|nr:hypothetical protein LTS10_008967 [Elasticomyces elasticus]
MAQKRKISGGESFKASEQSVKKKQRVESRKSTASQHKAKSIDNQKLSTAIALKWYRHPQTCMTPEQHPRGRKLHKTTKNGATFHRVRLDPPEWPITFYDALLEFAHLESEDTIAFDYIKVEFRMRRDGNGPNAARQESEGFTTQDVKEAIAQWHADAPERVQAAQDKAAKEVKRMNRLTQPVPVRRPRTKRAKGKTDVMDGVGCHNSAATISTT